MVKYSIDTVLEIVEDAPQMVTCYFSTSPESLEGRSRDNVEIEYVTDMDGDDIDFEDHRDDLMKAINNAAGKWVLEYDD